MTDTLETRSATLPRTHAASSKAPASAKTIMRLLEKLAVGTLELELPDGSLRRFGTGAEPLAVMQLNNWHVFSAVIRSGDIGFAETYIHGDWHTPDLPGLLRLLIENRERLESVLYGSWWGSLIYRIRHMFHRNSRRGSRRNIHAHYDLGNTFYKFWLDETMNYSSALFSGDYSQPLPQAQWAKIHRALDQVRVQPGHRVLEIGCGWGAVAEATAARYDAHLTGVTLSTEQLAYGQQRLRDAGLANKTDLRLQDYRDIDDGPFDAIVSIEMFEAVGQAYWPEYFNTLANNLKPGARACVQSITIRNDLFDRYAHSTDFIQQYIFPGGMLPSQTTFVQAAQAAGLEVESTFSFGRDYAETLRRWRQPFQANEQPIRELGFDTRFMRTWDFYLCYCEAAFDTGNTDVIQFTLRKPE